MYSIVEGMEFGSSNSGAGHAPAAANNEPSGQPSSATGNRRRPVGTAADRESEAMDRQYWRSWERHGIAYLDFIESIQDPLVDEEEKVDDATVPVVPQAQLSPPPPDDFIGLRPAPWMDLGWQDDDRAVPPRRGRSWLDDAEEEFNPDHLDPDRMRRWRNSARAYQSDIEQFDRIIAEQEEQIRHLEEAINQVVLETSQRVPQ